MFCIVCSYFKCSYRPNLLFLLLRGYFIQMMMKFLRMLAGHCLTFLMVPMTKSKLLLKLGFVLGLWSFWCEYFTVLLLKCLIFKLLVLVNNSLIIFVLCSHSSPSVLIPALRTVGNIVTGDDVQTQVGST